ncbi:MAG: hypothetical protein KJZ83_19620 [Burkholderiaceae bacterium]|nr:hypothetical protein [Burkholderiaceae bacterium]
MTFAFVVFARCSPFSAFARIALVAQKFESIVITENAHIGPNRSLDEASNRLAIGPRPVPADARTESDE